MKIKSINWQRYYRIATQFTLLLAISLIMLECVFILKNKNFDMDEFQHAHILWNLLNGKDIYTDFFEHHGPLYPLINTVLYKIFSLEPASETLIFFRYISLIYLSCLFYFFYKIIFSLTKSFRFSCFSLLTLAAIQIIKVKGIEIRPDVIQNLLLLISVYFLLSEKRPQKWRHIFSGIAFSLCILANPKSIVFLPAVLFCILLDSKEKSSSDSRASQFLFYFIGAILPFSFSSFYFLLQGSLYEYFYYNFYFNLIALPYSTGSKHLIKFFFEEHSFTAILLTIGIINGSIYSYLHLRKKQENLNLKKLCGFALTAFLLFFLKLFQQLLLMVLPLLLAWIMYCLFLALTNSKLSKIQFSAKLGAGLILLLILHTSFKYIQSSSCANCQNRKELDSFLASTPRSTVVPYFWGSCPEYVFNNDLSFYWQTSARYSKLFEMLEGRPLFGVEFITKLKNSNAMYIVSEDYKLKEVLSNEAMDYIKNNYHHVYGCLLKKR